jgi:hypothetical protein
MDLTARPLIWFTPQPATRLPGFDGGSVDFFELFDPDASWTEAAGRIHVFKLYDKLGLTLPADEDQWRTAIEGSPRGGWRWRWSSGRSRTPGGAEAARASEPTTGSRSFG